MSNSDKKTNCPALIIMKRELKSFYSGPIAYIVSGAFLVLIGILFFTDFFLGNRAELRRFFMWLPVLFSCFIPALTMRLFAEEKKSGSFETLMTLPVKEIDVVTGKYLASFLSTLIMVAPTLLYLITLCIFGDPDFGPIIGGYIGIIFLCASYTSIGLFASSVTKNQIIAFFIGLLICLALTYIDSFLIFMPSSIVTFFGYLSAKSHFSSIAMGVIDTRDILYFVSLTAVFFVLTVRKIVKEGR